MESFEIPRDNNRLPFAGILLFGLLAMTARNAIDPDLWWHLRTGQMIVETGYVPHGDPFSFTRTGHAWVSHEWLSEVVFYQLWKHGGAAALIAFSALITTAGFMLLYFRCLSISRKTHWAAVATAVGALASAPSWGVRPQMFTFTLASLLLWLIESGEDRPRLLLWIPPLFLLWLNLHAGFALGPALLLAYGIGLTLETAAGKTPWQQSRPILLRLLLLLSACLALVPLNPSGPQLYRYPLDTLRSPGMRAFIGEWRSPDFHNSLYSPFLLVWLLLVIALASSRARPRGRIMLPLLLTSFAALDAVRHIPIFVLVAIPVIAAALPVTSGSAAVSQWRPNSPRLRPLFNAAVVFLIAVFAVVRWASLAGNQNSREEDLFPEKAIASLASRAYPRNLFAYYDWGGYAIWKLYPQYRVFVDGRADLYGDELLRQSVKTVPELRTGWGEVLDDWKVEAVLMPVSCAISQALLLDPEWHVAFSDSQAVLLVRRHMAPKTAAVPSLSPGLGEAEKMFPTAFQICETKAHTRMGLVPRQIPSTLAPA